MSACVDIAAIQVQYEVLGETDDAICEQFQISKSLLEYMVEQKGWKRLPLQETGVVALTDTVLEDVNARLRAIQYLKQKTLNPRYIALEAILLSKLQNSILAIPQDDPLAIAKLKEATGVFTALRAIQPGANAKGGSDESKPSLTVVIQNKVGMVDSGLEAEPVTYTIGRADCVDIDAVGDGKALS